MHVGRTVTKAFRTFARAYPIFKRWRLNVSSPQNCH